MKTALKDFRSRLCGDCHYFMHGGERSDATGGRLPGVCAKFAEDVTRTDWCHDPKEQRLHELAIGVYDETKGDNRECH